MQHKGNHPIRRGPAVTQKMQRPVSELKRPGLIDLDRISWDDLRVFVVAARHESFRKAASDANLSAATVTRRIEALEQQFGFRVFDRLPDGVRLTREGQWVLSTAQRMEQASIGLRRFLDQDVTTRGVIRCGITEGIGTYWVLPKLVDFNRANPYSVIDLQCTMNFADVARMETDVAVQLARPTSPDLKVVKLGRLHIYPFAAPRYLETFGKPGSKADLARHRIIDQVSPQIPKGTLETMLGLENIEGVVAVRTNASSAHFYAIELGVGIGVLPTYAVPLGANVVPLDLDIQRPLDIWLTYHPDIRDVPRVALFIDWLRDIFDPAKYPWFRDEFIHPRELVNWRPSRPGSQVEPARGVIAHPTSIDDAAVAA
jgi:DNA-binding transcriptional LysR family regulator